METTPDNIEKLDFVPSDNAEAIVVEMKAWLMENVSGLMRPGSFRSKISEYSGGYLRLELGGPVADPGSRSGESDVSASFIIDAKIMRLSEDPDESRWCSDVYMASVSIPGYDAAGRRLARLRAELYMSVVELAARFDKAFENNRAWVRLSTKAQRDAVTKAFNERIMADTARLKLSQAVKDAIHTTCKRMRVGDERYVTPPDGVLPGTYDVDVEKKTYAVEITVPCGAAPGMRFRRIV